MKELEKIKCRICEELGVLKEFKPTSVGIHLNAAHPGVTLEEYYLKYLEPCAEGKCKFCNVLSSQEIINPDILLSDELKEFVKSHDLTFKYYLNADDCLSCT